MNTTLKNLVIAGFLIFSTLSIYGNSVNKYEIVVSDFTSVDTNTSAVFLAVDEFQKSSLSIEIFESEYDTTVDYYSSNIEYEFNSKGIIRGVDIAEIAFSNYRTDPITGISYKTDSIGIIYKFQEKVPVNSEYYNSYFSKIENQEHLEYFTKRVRNKNFNQLQNGNDDWFNEDLNYYKFYTSKDGISRIKHSDLIEIDSKFIGKKSNSFIIYNRGKELVTYSTSPVIQHDEYIYFVGSHAKGDTSHYDFYFDKEPYFITYDESKSSSEFTLIDNLVQGNKIESVEIDNHYEIDNVYGNGFDVTDTEQSLCENWYQEELRPPNEFNVPEKFSTNFSLFPTSSLDITYNFGTNIFYLPETIKTKTIASVNTHIEDTLNTSKSQVIEKQFSVNTQNLLLGGNTYSLYCYKAVEDDRTDVYNGVIGFDYLNISGFVEPIANNNYFTFLFDGSNNSYVDIEGFSNETVVSIDTTNNTIQFPNTENSNRIVVDSKESFISFYYNYQLLSDQRYGYYIIEGLGSLDRISYFDNSEQFIQKLNSINHDKLAVLINLESEVESNALNYLENNFSLNNTSQVDNKYFIIKNNDNIIEENSDFIDSRILDDKYYKARINLRKGEESRRIVNSLLSIEEPKLFESKINKIDENEYDVIYLYHKSLDESITDYVNFISTKENKSALVLDVEQLYDTYGYGIESPHSIKKFLQLSYDNWNTYPEYLVLIGDATWDPRKLMDDSFVDQMIPAYGIPYSDNFYGTLEGNDQLPELIVGRIPVNNNEELNGYLNKIKTYYNVPQSPWMKQVLQLSGGDDRQKEDFADNMHDFNIRFRRSSICFDTTTIGKTINSTISDDKANEIKKSINEGKIWVNFLGHGSPHVIDMSGWEAPNLNNIGKYGVLNTLSCNTSAFAEPHTINSIGEDYVTISNKGFVATIGGTSTTFVSTALFVSTAMYETLLNDNNIERNLGKIYNSYKPSVRKSNSTLNQVVLLGDPLLSVRIPDKPDLAIFKKDVTLKNNIGSSIITELDEELIFESTIYNLGLRTNDSIKVMFIHTFENSIDTILFKIDEVCYDGNLVNTFDIKNRTGEHYLKVILDYDSTSNDFNYTNNVLDFTFNVFPQGIQPLDPQNFWNISAKEPIIRFVDPSKTEKLFNFKVYNYNNELVYETENPLITDDYIDLIPDGLINDSYYRLEYNTTELATGTQSSTKNLFFHCTNEVDSTVNYTTNKRNLYLNIDNFILDENNITFDDIEYGVELSSARGRLDGTAERHATINTINKRTNEKFTFVNRLQRGFNIVVIPDIVSDTTYEVLHLDTWDSNFDEEDIYKHSRWLDNYLTDSLRKGDYLLLATADVPTRAPQKLEEKFGPDSTGSISRIKLALEKLGANNADKLDFNTSYVLFTRVGYPESTIDNYTLFDTVKLETEFKRYRENGIVTIPNIGRVKDIKAFQLDATSDNISTNVSFVDSNNDTLYSIDGTQYNFNDIDTNINTDLSAIIGFSRDSVGADFRFNMFNINFIPVAELAINAKSSKLNDSIVERALVAKYDYKVSNISPRSNSERFEISLSVANNFNNYTKKIEADKLIKNSSKSHIWEINTEDMAIENTLTIEIDSARKINELYYFNNLVNSKLKVREDTTKPYLIAYYNDQVLKNNDKVTIKPQIIIELYDNSTLEVIKENVIFARLNRKAVLDNTSDYFKFELINQGDLKARLTFVMSDSLDIGQNVLEVVGEDATGNKADTLKLNLYVPEEYQLSSSINYPNPFSESTNIQFLYYGKEVENIAIIEIYNTIGKLVHSNSKNISFGLNDYEWDGLNIEGSSTSTGVYFYKIELREKPSKSIHGKMIKVN